MMLSETAHLTRISLSMVLSAMFIMMGSSNSNASDPVGPVTSCNNRLLQQPTGFEIRFDRDLRSLSVGQHVHLPVVVRFPKNGAEVHAAPVLKCEGFIPRLANITQVRITHVTGLPHGMTWRSGKTDPIFAGGETACFWVEGKPEKAGQYNVEISSLGTGHAMGLSTTNICKLHIKGIEVHAR